MLLTGVTYWEFLSGWLCIPLGEILDAPEATACPISCSIGWMNDLTKYPKRVTRESQQATSWIGSQTCSAFGIELMWCYQRVKGACRTLAEKSYFYFLNLHWQRKTRKHAKENGRCRLDPRRHHQSRAGSPTVGLGLSVIKFPFSWFVLVCWLVYFSSFNLNSSW